jgi:plastocyanin
MKRKATPLVVAGTRLRCAQAFTGRTVGLCAAAAMAALLAGCGGRAGAAGGARTIQIVGDDSFRFAPAEIRVKPNEKVTLRLRNTGVLVHDLYTRGQTADAKIEAAPGQSASGTFIAAAQPGRYEFYCAQPGHEQAGMKGTIIIE